MSYQDYSTLEVNPNYLHQSGLEVSSKQPPQVVQKADGEPPYTGYQDHYGDSTNPVQANDGYANEAGRDKEVAGVTGAPSRKRICGLAPMWFWIALIATIVIIGAAVGGGVGGSLSHKSSSNAAAIST